MSRTIAVHVRYKMFVHFLAVLCKTTSLRHRPHYSVFKLKRSCFTPDTAIVHTAMPKTITENVPFENGNQSEAIWKQCFLKTLFTSVDGEKDAIWKRWRHQNRHDRVPDHSTVSIQNGGQTLPCGRYIEMHMRQAYLSMRTEGIKAFSKRIRRCSVDGRKRYENVKCGLKSFSVKKEQNSSVFVWKRISVDGA